MPDINIANLPTLNTPATPEDTDVLHISRSTTDFQASILEFKKVFDLVDIAGLDQTTAHETGDFLAIDTNGQPFGAGNKKVSLFNMGKLYQHTDFFVSAGTPILTDKLVWRDGASEELEETSITSIQTLTTDWPALSTSVTGTGSDTLGIFSSGIEKISLTDLRKFSLDPTTFNAVTTPADGDLFNIFDISAGVGFKPSSIRFDVLKSAIAQDVSDFVDKTTNQEIGGTKTFTSPINTDEIVEDTTDAGVTIDGVLIKDNNVTAGAAGIVTATTLKGKFIGSGGDTTNRYIDIDGDDVIVKTSFTRSFRPVSNSQTNLGENSIRWRDGYFADVHTTGFDATGIVNLPLDVDFNNIPMFRTGTNKINTTLLQFATEATGNDFNSLEDGFIGVASLANSFLVSDGSFSDVAITPNALAGALEGTFTNINIPSTGTVLWRIAITKINIGGFFLNFGTIRKGDNSAFLVTPFFTRSDMGIPLMSANRFVVQATASGELSGGSDPLRTIKAYISTEKRTSDNALGFASATGLSSNPGVKKIDFTILGSNF